MNEQNYNQNQENNQNIENKSVYSGDQPVIIETPTVEVPTSPAQPTITNVTQEPSPTSTGVNTVTTVPNVHFPNTEASQNVQVQANSTNLQSPAVSQVVISPVPTNDGGVPPEKVDLGTNSNSEPPKKGNGRIILLILFFILLFIFIFFLPNISEYLSNGGGMKQEQQLNSGVLTCTRSKTTDETDISYEVDFRFTNKKLTTSTMNITTESESKKVISEKKSECQNLSTIAEGIEGISITCSSSDTIHTMLESYDYQLIDNNGLTKFTEAGGTYPEYQYQDDIYDIQTKMIKAKYDCEIKAQ